MYAYVVLLYPYVSRGSETEEKVELFVFYLFFIEKKKKKRVFKEKLKELAQLVARRMETGSWHQVVGD